VVVPGPVSGDPFNELTAAYDEVMAVAAGPDFKIDQRVRFGFHNFRHSLASSLVKLKCDPKTVQGILRHEDVRTTMQLYAQSDQESRLEAQGKFLALLLGDKAHLLTEAIQ
jgi:integrase